MAISSPSINDLLASYLGNWIQHDVFECNYLVSKICYYFNIIILSCRTALFSGVTFDLELGKYIWSLLYDRNVLELTSNISVRTSYPILPWISVISLGYLYGYIFTNQIDTSKRNKILAISSVLCFSIFVIFRFFNIYGETIPFILNSNDFVITIMSFFNVTKYPPSFLFVMIP